MILVFFGCGAVKDKLVTFGYCQLFFVRGGGVVVWFSLWIFMLRLASCDVGGLCGKT